MVSTKSALSAYILLLSSFAFARNMDENTGYITKASHDIENGEFDFWRAPTAAPTATVARREPVPANSYSLYDPKLVSILYSKKQWEFCKAYIILRPTVTQVVTVTACGYGQRCSPTTITTVVRLTLDTTATVTGATSTVTIESVATSMTTVTETVPNPTLTSTVGPPTVREVAQKRYVHPPYFLNRYKPAQISAACSQLVKHVIHTKTKTQTRTVSGTPKTATQTVTQRATNTILTTTIPVDTITNVVSTTTVTTTETSTIIPTVCPSAIPGIGGIGVSGGTGHLEFPSSTTDVVGCCSACYASPSGCSAWMYAPGFCVIAFNSGPNPSTQCPSGPGTAFLFPGGNPSDFGGPGPCLSGDLSSGF